MTAEPAAPRVLLLVPARTYRAADFLAAASRLGLDLVVGSDGALPLGGRPVVPVNPADPEHSAEPAARCIGGLCSRVLRFPGGRSLEEMVLANALGRPIPGHRGHRPSGVLMLPVPRPGVLRAVEGRTEAAATPGVTGLTITIPPGQCVRPLPEGDRYLGFIFAEGDTQDRVEQALRVARERLRVVIR